LNDYPKEEPGYQYAAKLLEYVKDIKDEKDTLKQAEEAFENENFDLAFGLFLKQETTRKTLQRILYCIQEIQSLQAFKMAWEYCQKVPPQIVTSLPSKSKQLYSDLEERFVEVSVKEVTDWCLLLQYIVDGGDEIRSFELARQGSDEWSPSFFLNNQMKLNKLIELLSDCIDSYPDFLKKILPILYTFFFTSDKIARKCKSISLLLLQFIAFFDSWTSSELSIAHDLTRNSLETGPTPSEYNDVVDSLSVIYASVKSPKHLTWVLDIVELLAIYPAPNKSNKITLFSDICGYLCEIKHRVCKEEWSALEILAKDYGFVEFIDGLRPKEAA